MDRQQNHFDTARRQDSNGTIGSGRLGRRWFTLVLVTMLLLSTTGCQIVIGVLMILQGLPKQDSDFRTKTGLNIEDKNKKVVVLCTSPEKAKQEHVALDMEIIQEVSRTLRANGVNVIEPNEILTWIDDHGGELLESDMLEIGQKFNVDYLIQIQLDQYSITDPGSPGLFRGNVSAKVRVWARDSKVAKKDDKKAKSKSKSNDSKAKETDFASQPLKLIYTRPYTNTYPAHQPISQDNESSTVFGKKFQTRVGLSIAQLFYDHRMEEEM